MMYASVKETSSCMAVLAYRMASVNSLLRICSIPFWYCFIAFLLVEDFTCCAEAVSAGTRSRQSSNALKI